MSNKEEGDVVYGFDFNEMPEGCIASIFALTTPTDVCRLAPVTRVFRSASESDVVWERFLPSDFDLIVARSEEGKALLDEFPTKKQLYMRLADRPLLIDGATESFWLDKRSGKKCLMLAARSLTIVWSDSPRYWTWTYVPESRFPEVAQLLNVCWLEIRGKIKSSTLSPETCYAAYLVFKRCEDAYGLDIVCETSVSVAGSMAETQCACFYERPPSFWSLDDSECARVDQYPNSRSDGWQELKIGEFFTHSGQGEEDEVEMSLMEVKAGYWKCGLIVEGIEVRPVRS